MKRTDYVDTALLDTASGFESFTVTAPQPAAAASVIYTLSGRARITVNLHDYEVCGGQLVTAIRGSVVRIESAGPGFRAYSLSYPDGLICDADLIAAMRISADLMVQHPVLELSHPAHGRLLESYCAMLYEINSHPDLTFREKMVKNVLESLLFALVGLYRDYCHTGEEDSVTFARPGNEAIMERFRAMVAAGYVSCRSIGFYAGKLCITPKHLYAVVKDSTGCTPSQLISRAVIMDAKSKLKSTGMSVSEIADSLNFPNPSFFCKYFRKHTGLTPRGYRTRIEGCGADEGGEGNPLPEGVASPKP